MWTSRFLIMVAPVILMGPAIARSEVHHVDCKGAEEYTTIQAAVDAAAPGDTIAVAPCVYSEQVSVAGKHLTIIGAGPESTELVCTADSAAMTVELPYGGLPFTVSALRVSGADSEADALVWTGGQLVLTGCEVTGSVRSGLVEHPDCSVVLTGCTLKDLTVTGGGETSRIEDSRLQSAAFFGEQYGPNAYLECSGSRLDELALLGCYAHSTSDSIGTVRLSGTNFDEFEARQSNIDEVWSNSCAGLRLSECMLGDVYYFWLFYAQPDLAMDHCTVTGRTLVCEGVCENPARVRTARAEGRQSGLLLQHNTFLGSLEYDLDWDLCEYSERYVRSNIVGGAAHLTAGDCIVVTHNDFVAGATISTPSDSIHTNMMTDPLFCSQRGSGHTLQSCSPCVGAGHDGEDIGASGVGCDCESVVENMSWGALKALFDGTQD